MTQPGMTPEPNLTPTPSVIQGTMSPPRTQPDDIRPFSFTASDDALADLRRRVAAMHWSLR